jgi:hypothetical protein
MRPFHSIRAAILWLVSNHAGNCHVVVEGRIRGYDPADKRLYVVAELDQTPMW